MAILVLLLLQLTTVVGWPDGSPCIRAAYESMNPLEAVEHQGGLQLSPPPFHIEIKQSCYWLNQPVELSMIGNTTKDQFKGFAMQPFVYQGTNAGQRVGQFINIDANGSWRQQCFRTKDSATHSHDEKKKRLTLFWKNDRDEQSTVQFVATVVVSLRQFWVKSVVSAPLPPCKLQREVGNWQKAAITAPPPAGRFKIETFRMFNQGNSDFLQNALANERPAVSVVPRPFSPVPQSISFARPASSFIAPSPVTQRPNVFIPALPQSTLAPRPIPQTPDRRLTQPIPLPQMQMNRRPSPFIDARRPLVSGTTPRLNNAAAQCFDREPVGRCQSWIRFCTASTYMRQNCLASCNLC
ncbi:Reeler domain protein [Aphelenchoides besseyi]|nr:Reeler domain protein [Aphelenchoides besseyi]KAI6199560.1 Reeler domain protein [Aphelenchoides besseyi]